ETKTANQNAIPQNDNQWLRYLRICSTVTVIGCGLKDCGKQELAGSACGFSIDELIRCHRIIGSRVNTIIYRRSADKNPVRMCEDTLGKNKTDRRTSIDLAAGRSSRWCTHRCPDMEYQTIPSRSGRTLAGHRLHRLPGRDANPGCRLCDHDVANAAQKRTPRTY